LGIAEKQPGDIFDWAAQEPAGLSLEGILLGKKFLWGGESRNVDWPKRMKEARERSSKGRGRRAGGGR